MTSCQLRNGSLMFRNLLRPLSQAQRMNFIISQCQSQNSKCVTILFARTKSTKSSSDPPGPEMVDLDDPIKFSTSEASKWSAHNTLAGRPQQDVPFMQPLMVSLSMSIFLIYFLALREENDMDERIGKPLWEKVPGLEKQQLEILLEHNLQNSLPTEDIVKRLEEIYASENASATKSN